MARRGHGCGACAPWKRFGCFWKALGQVSQSTLMHVPCDFFTKKSAEVFEIACQNPATPVPVLLCQDATCEMRGPFVVCLVCGLLHLLVIRFWGWRGGWCKKSAMFISGPPACDPQAIIIGMKTWLSLKMGLNSDGFLWITTVDHHFRPPASGRRSSHSARYLLTHLDHVTNPIEAQIWEGVVAPGLVLVASCLELS